ncbi:MAG: phage head morphogenesis protein [Enterobacteriaceae bacterium]|nr:phage head morphogenesis protein [Enterobacteriaceae bacterium]
MAKQIRFKAKRERWATQRKALMKGEPLHYPSAVKAKYQASLQKLISAMIKDYQKELTMLNKDFGITTDASIASQTRIAMSKLRKKWLSVFSKRSASLADKFVSQVDAVSKRSLNESLKSLSGGLTIQTPEMPEAMKDKIIAATAENVSLIKSIPEKFHYRVESAALRSIASGGEGAKTIYQEIMEIGEVTEKRAKFIAEDQTRKLTTAANQERAKSAGIKKGIWHHSSGSAEPRRLHVELDGTEFDLDNPPVIDLKTGQRGLPGVLPNCKCFWTPVVDFGD